MSTDPLGSVMIAAGLNPCGHERQNYVHGETSGFLVCCECVGQFNPMWRVPFVLDRALHVAEYERRPVKGPRPLRIPSHFWVETSVRRIDP